MHVRINDVTVSADRVDELAQVLSDKALPVVMAQKGCQGMLCAADRATGNCAIVSMWNSRESLDASESAVAIIRSETVDVTDARLNRVMLAEVMREVRSRPSQVGSRSRVVRLAAPAGSTAQLVDFYDKEAVPRLQAQDGFLNARLIRDLDNDGEFAAVSHWTDAAALEASDTTSGTLRELVGRSIAGTTIEGVSAAEIILVELAT
jgi:quinol monooxygenase YgiN